LVSWGYKTLEPIVLKFTMADYPQNLHTALEVLGGVGVNFPHCVLIFFFSSLVAFTEQSIEPGLTLNAPLNVFGW